MKKIEYKGHEVVIEQSSMTIEEFCDDSPVKMVLKNGRRGGWLGKKEAISNARGEGKGPFVELAEAHENLVVEQRKLRGNIFDGHDEDILLALTSCQDAANVVRELACAALQGEFFITYLDNILNTLSLFEDPEGGPFEFPDRVWDFDDDLRFSVEAFAGYDLDYKYMNNLQEDLFPSEIPSQDFESNLRTFFKHIAEKCGWKVFPVYRYEHGGVALSCRPFGDKWDSGQAGFAYVIGELEDGTQPDEAEVCKCVEDFGRVLNGELLHAWVRIDGVTYSTEDSLSEDEVVEQAKNIVDMGIG